MSNWTKISTKDLRQTAKSYRRAAQDADRLGNHRRGAEAAREARAIEDELRRRGQ
jgi:hypothetical protein